MPQSQSQSTEPQFILNLKNISKEYKSFGSPHNQTVFDGINLQIKEGEFVTIIGRSGCGKSTLLNIIAGLDKSYSGDLFVEGKPVRGTGPDRIVVFQEDALFPWLNVIDNIEFGLRQAGVTKQIRTELAMNYLNTVGLADFANSNIHQLSGGMKQRVAIARALSLNPKILLMDEPFASLDVHTRQSLCSELLRIHQETKKTILFVTHNIEEAVLLGDRVILLSQSTKRISREYEVHVPRPRNVKHIGLREIVSEAMEELKEIHEPSKTKRHQYIDNISI